MSQLIVFVDCDPTGLRPMYQAETTIEGKTITGGWWSVADKAIERLVAAVAPTLIAPCVVTVERYTDAIDARLAIVATLDPEMPIGAVVTRTPVARRCVRCGHFECPCCADWCDACCGEGEDTHTKEGDWWIPKDGTHAAWRVHATCTDEGKCVYPPEESGARDARLAIIDALGAATENRWPHGGAFGVTDDGRIWYGPSSFDEEKDAWRWLATDDKNLKRAEALVRHCDAGKTQSSFVRTDVEILRSLLRLAGAAMNTRSVGPSSDRESDADHAARHEAAIARIESGEDDYNRTLDEREATAVVSERLEK